MAKILIIDDIIALPSNKERYTTLLQQQGHSVTIVNNQEDAFNHLDVENRWDIVFVDTSFPEFADTSRSRELGFSVAGEFAAEFEKATVVMISTAPQLTLPPSEMNPGGKNTNPNIYGTSLERTEENVGRIVNCILEGRVEEKQALLIPGDPRMKPRESATDLRHFLTNLFLPLGGDLHTLAEVEAKKADGSLLNAIYHAAYGDRPLDPSTSKPLEEFGEKGYLRRIQETLDEDRLNKCAEDRIDELRSAVGDAASYKPPNTGPDPIKLRENLMNIFIAGRDLVESLRE